MKCFPIICLGATFLLGFTSCTSMKQVNSQQNSDDVYYSLKDAKKDKKADQIRLAARQKQEEAQANQLKLEKETAAARANKGSEYYKEDFNYDDYYDDEYAARLRRFNHPVNNYSYYDNYYTNSYFYNQNPYNYGSSIYNGYQFWGPSYYAYNYCPSSYWNWNNGWSWGTGYNNGWGNSWGNYYDPWNTWGNNSNYGYGYNSFGNNPYNNNGYGNNGYNNYYYNSFDNNSNYYGPRNTPSSSDGRVSGSGGPTFGERFASEIAQENNLINPTRAEINQIVGIPPVKNNFDKPSVNYPSIDAEKYQPNNTNLDHTRITPPAPIFNNEGTAIDATQKPSSNMNLNSPSSNTSSPSRNPINNSTSRGNNTEFSTPVRANPSQGNSNSGRTSSRPR